jgi:hypothetical protein
MGDLFPAIALGGPGANALAAQIYEDLPVAWNREQRASSRCIPTQASAAVWGMDHVTTREAVDVPARGLARPLSRPGLHRNG